MHFLTPYTLGRGCRVVPRPRPHNACRLSHAIGLASSAFARHYSRNHGCFLFLWVLRCFTSPRSLHTPYVFRRGSHHMTGAGSPIRTSSDQRSVGSSPRLIAASYVLHRLLVPRHPPCALNNLATPLHQTPRRPPHTRTPTKGCAARGRPRAGLQSKKMLASTVQFSTTHRPPPGTAPANPTATGSTSATTTGGTGTRTAPTHELTTPTRTLRPGRARSLRTQQRAYAPRPPRPRSTPAHRAGRTGSRQRSAAELVSVPPSSTVSNTRDHPVVGGHHGPSTALDHQHQAGGQRSLERR